MLALDWILSPLKICEKLIAGNFPTINTMLSLTLCRLIITMKFKRTISDQFVLTEGKVLSYTQFLLMKMFDVFMWSTNCNKVHKNLTCSIGNVCFKNIFLKSGPSDQLMGISY